LEIQLIISLNFEPYNLSLDAKLIFINIRSSLMITILFLFMQKLGERLTLTSVLAERKALRMR